MDYPSGSPSCFWADWSVYQKGLVDATRHLYAAATRFGVRRLVYISSESVLQDKEDLLDVTEETPYPALPSSYYGRAKKLAEQLLLAEKGKTEVVILRPTFIWGENVVALDTFEEKIRSGQFVWIDKGEVQVEMVHVDNVVEAIVLACERGRNREIYLVTDDEAKTIKRFLTDLMAQRQIAIPDRSLPAFLVKPLAVLVEWVWKTLHLSGYPPLTRFDLSFIAMNRRYRIEKIKAELGYRPVVDYQEGLNRMARR